MKFSYLGSGSEGNSLLIRSAKTTVMLDCGFGIAETVRRLQRAGTEPEGISAIVVTHEHDDHIGGVARFAAKYKIPVWLTPGTWRQQARGAGRLSAEQNHLCFITGYQAFAVGDIQVIPYPVPHDAGEPAQYVFEDGQHRLGVLTDAGMITPHIRAMLSGCDALALECNHDLDLLEASNYPPSLKQRIRSKIGHLDNHSAASLFNESFDSSRLKHLVGVHLSQSNNRPSLVQEKLSRALSCSTEWIQIADQHTGLDWRQCA